MRPAPRHSRRGISLLEVLISIGILSIGLLATLSLIPAGRTYMYKAAVDDRAAALIPAAFETISTRGLLGVNAVSWTIVSTSGNDPEYAASGVVIREQAGSDVTLTRSGTLDDSKWTIQTTDTETITAYHAASSPTPFTISGTISPGTPPATYSVDVSGSPSIGPIGADTTDSTTGTWTVSIDSSQLPLPAPKMTITGSGPGVGQVNNTPYTDYTFTATYVDGMSVSRSANPTPATYRQYGDRRAEDVRTGTATTTYTAPSNAATSNNDPTSATAISMATLENASTSGRNVAARSVTRTINGSLWRMTLGTVATNYTQKVNFADAPNAAAQPQTPACSQDDIADTVGTFTSGSTPLADDQDWYSLAVRAGEIITVTTAGSTGSLKKDPFTGTYFFPVYFNTTTPSLATMLPPMAGLSVAGSSYSYFIPADGTIITCAALLDGLNNTFAQRGQPRTQRSNPMYAFTITRLPSERVIVVDPLAATRLDKAILDTGGGAGNANILRRQRFADYYQTYTTGGTQQRIIPRLNWAALTPTTLDMDAAVATSELLFRDTDSLQIDTTGDPDTAPGPLFDLTSAKQPVRRQAAGKMSWLMMLQPEDPGPAAVNWTAGKWFDVSVVVFEDRALPSLAGAPYTGEYAQANVIGQNPLAGVWSDLDGALTVTIPNNTNATDLTEDDEVRRLFRTGAWILLAPKWIDPTVSALESTQRLDWVRIQSARLGSNGGARTVTLLLETEPSDTTLNRSLQSSAPNYDVVVMAYSGVVAVVNRSVQLE